MTHFRWAAYLLGGLAFIPAPGGVLTVNADPSNIESFQGCVIEIGLEQLALRTSSGPVTFNLTRMAPVTIGVKTDDCVTVRAYPGAGAEMSTWFAESVEEGDERLETTGREITKESTRDSPAKDKKKDDDD
jgi:hypothetical protein